MAAKIRVLLVDDEKNTRTVYSEILTNADFEVEQAADGLEALEKMSSRQPDAVITGIIMPRMDGFGLVEEMKKSTVLAKIPVIFLSHMGREEDRQRALKLGVKDFVLRDFTPPKELIDRLKSFFTHQAAEYVVAIDPASQDILRLLGDFGLANASGRPALRLTVADKDSRRFHAELTLLS